MSSTSSSGFPGWKSQLMYSVLGVSALGSIGESGLNGDVRAQAVWRTAREYSAHAFDGLGQAVAVTEDSDEAPQVVGRTAWVVAGDESPHDMGDGDHRGAGHRPLDPAWCRPRTGSRRPASARRSSPGRASRIQSAIERGVPRPHGGGAPRGARVLFVAAGGDERRGWRQRAGQLPSGRLYRSLRRAFGRCWRGRAPLRPAPLCAGPFGCGALRCYASVLRPRP